MHTFLWKYGIRNRKNWAHQAFLLDDTTIYNRIIKFSGWRSVLLMSLPRLHCLRLQQELYLLKLRLAYHRLPDLEGLGQSIFFVANTTQFFCAHVDSMTLLSK